MHRVGDRGGVADDRLAEDEAAQQCAGAVERRLSVGSRRCQGSEQLPKGTVGDAGADRRSRGGQHPGTGDLVSELGADGLQQGALADPGNPGDDGHASTRGREAPAQICELSVAGDESHGCLPAAE